MPFAGYKNFAECVRRNRGKRSPEGYCAVIMRRVEGVRKERGFKYYCRKCNHWHYRHSRIGDDHRFIVS